MLLRIGQRLFAIRVIIRKTCKDSDRLGFSVKMVFTSELLTRR